MSAYNLYLLFGALGGVVIVVTAVLTIGRKMFAFFRRVGQFLVDWNGEEERPGVPRKRGVMERLTSQDRQLDHQDGQLSDLKARLATVEGELQNNSGSTVKDAVHRMDRRVAKMDGQIEKIEKAIYGGV